MASTVAIVTGGNRGIGFEICRQLSDKGFCVLLTARDPYAGKDAAAQLEARRTPEVGSGQVHFHQLDVTDDEA